MINAIAYLLLWLGLGYVLILLPAQITAFKARRERKREIWKYRMHKIVNRLQEYMHDGKITDGDFAHDHFFHIVFHAQFKHKYLTFKQAWRACTRKESEVEAIIKQWNEELSALPPEFSRMDQKYFSVYGKLIRSYNPAQYAFGFGVFFTVKLYSLLHRIIYDKIYAVNKNLGVMEKNWIENATVAACSAFA